MTTSTPLVRSNADCQGEDEWRVGELMSAGILWSRPKMVFILRSQPLHPCRLQLHFADRVRGVNAHLGACDLAYHYWLSLSG